MILTDLLNLSNVPRWGICPRNREQSVADHTFRVAVIAHEIAERLGIELTAADYWYILCHDADESWTGDISGLSKHAIPELQLGAQRVYDSMGFLPTKSATPQWSIIKAADILDCLAFANAWIPEPRRYYIWERNIEVLKRHCGWVLSEQGKDLYPIAHGVLMDIINDRGRCSTPDWLHDKR